MDFIGKALEGMIGAMIIFGIIIGSILTIGGYFLIKLIIYLWQHIQWIN